MSGATTTIHRRRPGSVLAAATSFLLAAGTATAQEAEEEAPASDPAEEQVSAGYPEGARQIGGPTDIDTDLDTSFPKPDSVFPVRPPDKYFDWKQDLYDRTGVKLAFGYQTLYQQASATLPGANDSAWGGWMQIEGKWDAINRGEDYQGSVTFDLDWRHGIGDNALPALFGTFGVGSLWPTDLAFFEWDPTLAVLYWEQWFEQGVFNLRVGKQLAAYTYDFFRFKDARTSFSSTPFSAHSSIPMPAFGQALSFKWWPQPDSALYVHGTLNDMNGNPEELGLDTFFEERQYFYGLEVGTFWRRSPQDFDHVHLDLFYADEKDSQPPIFPNEAGGGFKLLGSKQVERNVGFASYTYNTAEGGGLGATFARHTVTAGGARLKPLGVRGEVGLGTAWMSPLDGTLRDQYGGEVYWKILLAPDLWVTPGFQFIFDPALNPQEDFVGIAQLKLRLAL